MTETGNKNHNFPIISRGCGKLLEASRCLETRRFCIIYIVNNNNFPSSLPTTFPYLFPFPSLPVYTPREVGKLRKLFTEPPQ
jgi:hypothetical protein